MKVFLSWSKDSSRLVATEFSKWLPRVIQECADPFISTETNKGDPWFSTITDAMERSRVGVVFISPENADEPWLNFESGALLTKFGKQRVCPVLIGLDKADYAGPLKNLQLTDLRERSDVLALLKTISRECERPLPDEILVAAFDAQWHSLENVVAEVQSSTSVPAKRKRTTDSKIDELLESMRELQRYMRTTSIIEKSGASTAAKIVALQEAAEKVGSDDSLPLSKQAGGREVYDRSPTF